jgi:hypothetical protein
MAVKFSAFTQKTTAESANVTEIVGYLSTGDENIRIAPSAFDTTYAFTTVTNSGTPTNVDFIATATKGTQASTTETVVFAAGSNVTLTAGTREITIASTDTNTTYDFAAAASGSNVNLNLTDSGAVTDSVLITAGSNVNFSSVTSAGFTINAPDTTNTYTLPITGDAAAVTATLTGSAGDTDPVIITAGTDISFSSVAGGAFTIDSTATGDTYDLNATTDGSNVDLNITSGSGTDNSTVQLTAGTGITLTRNSSAEVTIDGTASATKLVVTKTGNNSDTIFTDITTGLTLPVSNSNFYVDIYISGVYQQKSTYAYSTATNGTITFTTAPPVTATDGIEFVTTV